MASNFVQVEEYDWESSEQRSQSESEEFSDSESSSSEEKENICAAVSDNQSAQPQSQDTDDTPGVTSSENSRATSILESRNLRLAEPRKNESNLSMLTGNDGATDLAIGDFKIVIPTRNKQVHMCKACFGILLQSLPEDTDREHMKFIEKMTIEAETEGCSEFGNSEINNHVLLNFLLAEFFRSRTGYCQSKCPVNCRFSEFRPNQEHFPCKYYSQVSQSRFLKEMLTIYMTSLNLANPITSLAGLLKKLDHELYEDITNLESAITQVGLYKIRSSLHQFALQLKPVVLETIAELISDKTDLMVAYGDDLVDSDWSLNMRHFPEYTKAKGLHEVNFRLIQIFFGAKFPLAYFGVLLSLLKTNAHTEEAQRLSVMQLLCSIFLEEDILDRNYLKVLRLLQYLLRKPEWLKSFFCLNLKLSQTQNRLEEFDPLGLLFRLNYMGVTVENQGRFSIFGSQMNCLFQRFKRIKSGTGQDSFCHVEQVSEEYDAHLQSILKFLLNKDPTRVFDFLRTSIQSNISRTTLSTMLGMVSPENSTCSSNAFSLTLSQAICRLLAERLQKMYQINFGAELDSNTYFEIKQEAHRVGAAYFDIANDETINLEASTKPNPRPNSRQRGQGVNQIQIAIISGIDIPNNSACQKRDECVKRVGNSTIEREMMESPEPRDSYYRNAQGELTRLLCYSLEIIRLHLIPTLQDLVDLEETYNSIKELRNNKILMMGNHSLIEPFYENLERTSTLVQNYLKCRSRFDDANFIWAKFLECLLENYKLGATNSTRIPGTGTLAEIPHEFQSILAATPVHYLAELKPFHEIYLKYHKTLEKCLSSGYLQNYVHLMELVLTNKILVQNKPARHSLIELLLLYVESGSDRMSLLIECYARKKQEFLMGLLQYYNEIGVGAEDFSLQHMVSQRWKVNMLLELLWSNRPKRQFGASHVTKETFSLSFLAISKSAQAKNYIIQLISDVSRSMKDLSSTATELSALLEKSDKSTLIDMPFSGEAQKTRFRKIIAFNLTYLMGLVQMLNYIAAASVDILDQPDCRQIFATTVNHLLTRLQSKAVQIAQEYLSKSLPPANGYLKLLGSLYTLLGHISQHNSLIQLLLSTDSGFEMESVSTLHVLLKSKCGTARSLSPLLARLPSLLTQIHAEEARLASPPPEYTCGISWTLMSDPVRLPASGAVVDKPMLLRHMAANGHKDPFTRTELKLELITEEQALRDEIRRWRDRMLDGQPAEEVGSLGKRTRAE